MKRSERLQNGLKVEEFRVYFQRSNLTIQIECNDQYFYEIDLERCNNSTELLDWILHIHSKTWGCSGGLLAAILTILDDACEEVFGGDIQSLLISRGKLNWKKPK